MTGFTGVDWESRTQVRLSADLAAGPGAVPLAEASRAWTAAGDDLAGIATELNATLRNLGMQWSVAGEPEVGPALRRMAEWLVELSGTAGRSGRAADVQSTAVEVARRTMPHPDALGGELPGILTVLGPAGVTLLGGMADLELAQQTGRLRAARVMASYEHAAAAAVRSWYTSTPSPNVVRKNHIQVAEEGGGPECRDSGHLAPGAGAVQRVSGGQTGAATLSVAPQAGLAVPAVVPGRYAHNQVGRSVGADDREEPADFAADGVASEATIAGDGAATAEPALTQPGAAPVGAPALPPAVPASAAASTAAAPVGTGAQAAYTQPAVVADRWVRIDTDGTAAAPPADPGHRPTWTDVEMMGTAATDYVSGAGSGDGDR